MARITIGFRVDSVSPAHVEFTVFMGPETGRGNCGQLRTRTDEFWLMVDLLKAAGREPHLTGHRVPR